MSNANTDYIIKSPNFTAMSNKKNDSIVIHHMAAPGWSAQTCGASFQNPSRQASSNYGIGNDGKTALYVDEKNRSWCTSSYAVDSHAVTIEVANSTGDPTWKISDKAMESLINLCADICKRNGIKKLYYDGKKGTLLRHCDFAPTGCPGPYIKAQTDYICDKVNAILNGKAVKEEKKGLYTVKCNYDLNIREDAGTKYKKTGSCKKGFCYTIVEEKKTSSGALWGRLFSGAGWICIKGKTKEYAKRM